MGDTVKGAVSPFYGLKNGQESATEYLENVEFWAEGKTDAAKASRICFRTNLEGHARTM